MTISEAVEGLAAVLAKQPIIPTFRASDFGATPLGVEASYEQHVRSYVPLAREGGGEEGSDVNQFERKLMRLVKDKRAPLGYITAEYGHGKTSTGLFLWQRARSENILAIPPFSFDAMEELVTGVAGWVNFCVGRSRPGLAEKVDAVRDRYMREGLEGLAKDQAAESGRSYADVLQDLRRLDQQGALRLRLHGSDYVNFLEEMTALALEAGYDGVLVVADEVQQYIEHEEVRNAREPIADLFDLVTTMYTRAGRLACGLIFLLPNKELGLINQQRGDLLARIKNNRLGLDLAQVYGRDFATRLWSRLSEEFGFRDIADQVITDEALHALGEIATRPDLSYGPRTVVDVLKLACQRFSAGATTPFGLLELVGSFERNDVSFDGLSKVRAAVQQALAHELVRGTPNAEHAVRLMAAFPNTGLTEDIQEREGVREAVGDLQRLAGGDLVALRGGGFDHAGRIVRAGVTLIALQPVEAQLPWLKGTIRAFRRDYFLGSDRVQRLAIRGFKRVLTERIFPHAQWRVDQEIQHTALSRNEGLLLRGTFPSTLREFPDRLVYCRIVRQAEQTQDNLPQHDVLIDFVLRVPVDQPADTQRQDPGRVRWVAANHVAVELNLLHRDPEANYVELNPGFEDIVAPYDVNPLLTLSLLAALQESLDAARVPGAEQANVRDLFQPALLGAAVRDLFNAGLGRTGDPTVDAADTRFVEGLFRLLCQRTYGDQYVTLMATGQWQNALRAYRGALERIDHPLVRNGQEPYQGTKKEVAELLNRTNAAFDNFLQTFPHLLVVEEQFRGDGPGAVRFTLHPLERRIHQLVVAGSKRRLIDPRTHQGVEAPVYSVADVYQKMSALGYRDEEVAAGIALLEARQTLYRDVSQGVIIAREPDVPAISDVRPLLEAVRARLHTLRSVLDPSFVGTVDAALRPFVNTIEARGAGAPNAAVLIGAKRAAERADLQIEQAREGRRIALARLAERLSGGTIDLSSLLGTVARPAAGGLFADQLNAVRVRLQREISGLKTQGDVAARSAREVQDHVTGNRPADKELVAADAKLKQISESVTKIQHQRDGLQGRVGSYREVERLLAEGTDLLNERLLPLEAVLGPQRQELDRWSENIEEALYTKRLDALEDAESWRTRLQKIKFEVARYEQDVKDKFGDRQRSLREILINEFEVPASQLAPQVTFNPLDPDGSYGLLEHQFRDALETVRRAVRQKVDEIRRSAREMGSPEKLSALAPDHRQAAETDMADVVHATESTEKAVLDAFSNLLRFAGSSGRIATIGELEAGAHAVIEAAAPVAQLWTRVQQLRRLLQETALTSDEQRAYEILLNIEGHGDADLIDFQGRMERASPGVDSWAMLRGLTTKSRVRVRIQVLRQ